jgi:glutathionylspermidine synthase
VRTLRAFECYAEYDAAWQSVDRAGLPSLNLDTWASGRRYLSLASLCLTGEELAQLRGVCIRFARLIDVAVQHMLDDRDWWPALAWPWPAIELARQEPLAPNAQTTPFGRFDCLLDGDGRWQVIEYNADTPSGGREASGLEPALARLHRLRPTSSGLPRLLVDSMRDRIARHPRPVRLVGVVSHHGWLEDMSQATWLASLLERAGMPALVGDVNDLESSRGFVTLRGRRIDALYRFYPVERLYRHAVFAPMMEAALDGKLVLLNGLRGFLAQSKACFAWLWQQRGALGAEARRDIERYLPPTFLARDPAATDLLPRGVVKHVNGREGDSVVFGDSIDHASWEARLLEGGHVVQRAVVSTRVSDVEIDEWRRRLTWVDGRVACVGGFVVGGRFGGCYTRVDGPITSARATYVATLVDTAARSTSTSTRLPRSSTA